MIGKQFTDLTKASALKDSDIIAVHDGNGLKSVTIEQLHASTANNAGAHNSVYRGKFLGEFVTREQYERIKKGTFEDLFIGDYWTIGGVNYRIAEFDRWLNVGDTKCVNHHVVIVPDGYLYDAQFRNTSSGGHEDGYGEGKPNDTTGGYYNSDMRKNNLNRAKEIINNAFTNHVLNYRNFFVNAVTGGKPTGGAWFDASVELMNEKMVYGSSIFESGASEGERVYSRYGIDNTQLQLFRFDNTQLHTGHTFWLRDVASNTSYCAIDGGFSTTGDTSGVLGVRPCFAIF